MKPIYKSRYKVKSKAKNEKTYHYHGNIHAIHTDKKPSEKELYRIAKEKYLDIGEVVRFELISVELAELSERSNYDKTNQRRKNCNS